MKYEVDSYILEYIESENKYYITFEDSVKRECSIEINKEIFYAYINSRKSYTKIRNEINRHIEPSPLTEIGIYKRAFYPNETAEEILIKEMDNKKVNEAMEQLTTVQRRRVELHIINKISIRKLAKIENVRKGQIEKSLKLGCKKIKKFLENRGGQN